MAKSEDSLFKLIKSLSRTEKGYLKKFASLHGPADKSVYIKLFDAMDGLKEYEEKLFKKKAQGKSFLKHFSSVKKYLFQLILKALNAYHSSINTENQVRNILFSADILFKKGFFKETNKLLDKAERLSMDQHDHLLKLEILHRRYKYIYRVGNTDTIEQFIEKFSKETRRYLQVENDVVECSLLRSRIGLYELRKKENVDYPEKIRKIFIAEALKLERKELSFYAKRQLYSAFYLHYILCENYLSAYKYVKKHVALLESDKDYILEQPQAYVATLHNLAYVLIYLKRYDEIGMAGKKIWEIFLNNTQGNDDLLSDAIFIFYGLELDAYLATGKFSKGIHSMPQDHLETRLQRIPAEHRAISYFNLACLHFGAAQFRKALKWLSLLNDSSLKNIRPDIQRSSRILNIMIHIELGHLDTLSYQIKSTQRFFSKQKEKYQYESIALHFFSKLPDIDTAEDKIKWLKEFKSMLTPLLKNQHEKQMLESSMIILWVESKLRNISIEEVAMKVPLSKK